VPSFPHIRKKGQTEWRLIASTHIAWMHQEKKRVSRAWKEMHQVVTLCGNRGFTSIRRTKAGH
jgi:hypothetical protein